MGKDREVDYLTASPTGYRILPRITYWVKLYLLTSQRKEVL